MFEDYYKILNVSKSVTAEELKKAYRKLALEYHPDKNNSIDAHEIFIKITEAYNILSTPEKKEIYDNLYNQYNSSSFTKDLIIEEKLKKHYEWAYQAQNEGEKLARLRFSEFVSELGRKLGYAIEETRNFFGTIVLFLMTGSGIYHVILFTYQLIIGESNFNFGLIFLYLIAAFFAVFGSWGCYDFIKRNLFN